MHPFRHMQTSPGYYLNSQGPYEQQINEINEGELNKTSSHQPKQPKSKPHMYQITTQQSLPSETLNWSTLHK